jgi:DnaJ-class molecular chaperone
MRFLGAWSIVCLYFLLISCCVHGIDDREDGKEEEKVDLYKVLGLDKECEEKDVRKAFRKLALDMHPDKVDINATEEERDAARVAFLQLQEAYDTLSDFDRRRKYDLSSSDVTYDIYEDDVGDRYTIQPFKMFARTAKYRMIFTADFQPNEIPPIMIPFDVNLTTIFHGGKIEKTYYRQIACDSCGGTGGKDGECTECKVCGGSGVGTHFFEYCRGEDDNSETYSNYEYGSSSNSNCNSGGGEKGKGKGKVKTHKYEQVPRTTCHSCKGKGCHPRGKCPKCGGAGLVMEEHKVTFHVPRGTPQGFMITLRGEGHRREHPIGLKSRGDVKVIVRYNLDQGWSASPDGTLGYEKEVQLLELAVGMTFPVYLPSGEIVDVSTHPVQSLVDLLEGFTLKHEGLGLTRPNARDINDRADLIVKVTADWDRDAYSYEDVVEVLGLLGIFHEDPSFRSMLGLFGFGGEGGADGSDVNELDETMYTIFPGEVEFIKAQRL